LSVLLVLLGLYAMMAIPFKSYTQPIIVLLVVPFGLVGGTLGHIFHGMPLSLMSVCGFLAVSGVIVNDTLVLVDRINQLRDESGDLRHAVQEGGASRFRAIFLTQITTFVGLLPLIFNMGSFIEGSPWLLREFLELIFGDNRSAQATTAQFLTPVSVAMGYGSLFATVITLYLVPLCYLAVEDLSILVRKLLNRPQPLAETPIAA
jgi:multidrug efflux pump subunit AcrB